MEKSLFFLFAGLNPLFNELDKNAIRLQAASLSNSMNLLVDLRRQSHAPADLFRCASLNDWHSTNIHQFGAAGLTGCPILLTIFWREGGN